MDNFVTSVSDFLGKIEFIPNNELKIAFLGVIVTAVIFALALLISSFSRINGLRKKLISVTKKVAVTERVDEENVENIYTELKRLPEAVEKGWGRFLEEKNGYPSDYMPAHDVLDSREYSAKNTFGKAFFCVLSVVWWVIASIMIIGVCKGDLSSVGIEDFTTEFSLVASIITTVLLPVAFFVFFYFLLDYAYGKQRKRLELCYASFQDILDARVVIAQKAEEPYAGDELEDIKAKVDELMAGRMEDNADDIEVFTVPESDVLNEVEALPAEEEPAEEEEPVEEVAEEEPAEEEVPPAEEAAAEEAEEEIYVPMTKEEESRYLSVLLIVVDKALADPDTTDEDLEEIAVLIETAKINGFKEEADQQILEECLIKLANRYYS